MKVVIALVGLLVIWLIASERKTRKWMKAFDLHSDMFNKYVELADDPIMSDRKWKEWLPIFEEADRICARDCPDMKFTPISLNVRRIIDDREIIED